MIRLGKFRVWLLFAVLTICGTASFVSCSSNKDFSICEDMVMEQKRTTPEFITELQPNEIFVFGSNLKGMHGGGAAYIAYRKFGAVMGQGVGLQGQSYAIPTMQVGKITKQFFSI